MNIVTVIPLARGINKENLSYFTLKNIPIGTIVTVPLRHKIIEAIVVNSEDLLTQKESIKAKDFKLKRLHSVKKTSFLPDSFWQTIIKAKDYFVTSSGALIYSILPQILWAAIPNINFPKTILQPSTNLKPEKLVLQTNLEDRLIFYKTYIRQNFAKKKSVFLCLPTVHDLDYFNQALSKGISEFVHVLDTGQSKKIFIKKLNNLFETDHPVLVIGLPIHLYLTTLLMNLDTVIIEKENRAAYRTLARPFIDFRVLAEILTAESKHKLILADNLLQLETIYSVGNKELNEIQPLTFRSAQSVTKEIIDLKKEWQQEKKFFVLSQKLKKQIKENLENKNKMFIFSLRKGLAGLSICHDCQTILECDHCGAPFTLYKTNSETTIFICNKCKNKKRSDVKCSHCGSWNLVPLGIGLSRVEDEIKELFNKAKIFKIDKESVKNHKQAQKIINDFYATPGGILLGTEMALYYLKSKIDFVVMASFDSLFSIPSFRINEKIIQILVKLEELATHKIIVQTKNPKSNILTFWQDNNLNQFYKEEIKDREKFFYPPFSTIIKITYQGSKENAKKEKNNLLEIFKEYQPVIFGSLGANMAEPLISLQMILKIPQNNWAFRNNFKIDQKLLAKLSSLPPSFTIKINPESIL